MSETPSSPRSAFPGSPNTFRIVRRDGDALAPIVRLGVDKFASLTDLFHFLMRRRLWHLIVLMFVAFVFANLIYAAIYSLLPGSISHASTFMDYYFFSVQTMATIGYGTMVPQTTLSHVLVCTEAFAGLIGFAMGSGLVLAHFARPTAKILFSRVAAVHRRNGHPVLTLRLANERNNQILDGSISLTYLNNVQTQEGEILRRFNDMKLERKRTPIFALTWTLVHPLDHDSPLFGKSADDLRKEAGEVLVTFKGVDETFSQQIFARNSYSAEEIAWNSRLVDILGVNNDGQRTIDFSKFHETQPWTF